MQPVEQTGAVTNNQTLSYSLRPSGERKHVPPINVFLRGQFLRQFVRDGPQAGARTVGTRVTPARGIVLFQVGLFECVKAPPLAPPPATPKVRTRRTSRTSGPKPRRGHETRGRGARPRRGHHSGRGERPPGRGDEAGRGHEVGGVVRRSEGRPRWRDDGDGGVTRVRVIVLFRRLLVVHSLDDEDLFPLELAFDGHGLGEGFVSEGVVFLFRLPTPCPQLVGLQDTFQRGGRSTKTKTTFDLQTQKLHWIYRHRHKNYIGSTDTDTKTTFDLQTQTQKLHLIYKNKNNIILCGREGVREENFLFNCYDYNRQ